MGLFSRKPPPPPPVFVNADPNWQRPADLLSLTRDDVQAMTDSEISAYSEALGELTLAVSSAPGNEANNMAGRAARLTRQTSALSEITKARWVVRLEREKRGQV